MELTPEIGHSDIVAGGFPELSALGKRIELLRIERGLSKQVLARTAGTSRQQLWRVMTGKSELTSSLCQRLADALRVDSRLLRSLESDGGSFTTTFAAANAAVELVPTVSLAEYLADTAHVERTLRTLPTGDEGRRLRLELLTAVEDAADEARVTLPSAFFALRAQVAQGTL
jgi:transcriptional regulator with XRE-family HTH domain